MNLHYSMVRSALQAKAEQRNIGLSAYDVVSHVKRMTGLVADTAEDLLMMFDLWLIAKGIHI